MRDVIRITDFQAPELDVYARLREIQLLNRHEPEKGIFIAESPRVIKRALDAGCEPLSFLAEERYLDWWFAIYFDCGGWIFAFWHTLGNDIPFRRWDYTLL